MNALIFLDFDGVLAPIEGDWKLGELRPSCVRNLDHLVKKIEARIVISSSWRYVYEIEEIKAILRRFGLAGDPVIDITPMPERRPIGVIERVPTRGDEIRAWIDLNSQISPPMVILDDDPAMGSLMPYFVKIKPEEGLLMDNVEHAIQIIKEQG